MGGVVAGGAGDFIRITDRQVYLEQQVLNVYFYRINDVTPLGDGYLTVFGDSFVDIVLPAVIAVQHEDLVHTELFLENLTNCVDILTYTDSFPVSGDYATGEGMPPFVSWGVQLIRESRTTRNGYKRFAGVPEAAVADGLMTGFGTEFAALETALAQDFTAGIVTYAAPVILKHPFVVPLVAPEYSDIGSALYRSVGSQNTRKLGRGV